MNRMKFVEDNCLNPNCLFFDPDNIYDKGIIGYSTDKQKIVYSFDKLVESLADDYRNGDYEEYVEGETDYETMAMEWLEFNTLRALPYYGENAPLVLYEGVDENEGVMVDEDNVKIDFVPIDINDYS